ncbi:class I SAM-dependent methyltransferase [Nonomuraea sp. SYSU D8015]|uniref:class I SAM-dependent methyltransferase n=1 Tax=Nonomuraea sp. SYSU D8015 TaxID=2593644 RepID=UPI0016601DF2|nr:class I SAM-dependent methyltransferase [Nonomuraea sp. SYSU D8015]
MSIFAIARNAMRPTYLPVMTHKVYVRIRHGHDRERKAATAWASSQAESLDEWGSRIDPLLWREAENYARLLTESAEPRVRALAELGVDLGGPGGIELLYFLTRMLCPKVVVETGVAAGWTTAAILAAIQANKFGHLYSSDFPCFRLGDPEQYIGHVVAEPLKDSWTLHLDGDRRNLRRILRARMKVDLAHYDSDKTRAGREFFLRRISPHLTDGHVLVMDDIQDNLVFQEYVAARQLFHVFEYRGKYIGMTGPGLADLEQGRHSR